MVRWVYMSVIWVSKLITAVYDSNIAMDAGNMGFDGDNMSQDGGNMGLNVVIWVCRFVQGYVGW